MQAPLACRWLSAPLLLLPAACADPPSDHACASAAPLSVCASDTVVQGIDVSTYQGVIDWAQVARSGRAFAIARASDGVQYRDPEFARSWSEMKAQGLIRGVYQFFRPGQDPIAQADLLLAIVERSGGLLADDLPPVLDVEVTDGQPPALLAERARRWLAHVAQATGKAPMIYTAAFMSGALGPGFGDVPLWVANWGVACPLVPSGWTSWRFWQLSSTGRVPGIGGDVDLDVFDGTLDELRAFARGDRPDAGPLADAGLSDAHRPDVAPEPPPLVDAPRCAP